MKNDKVNEFLNQLNREIERLEKQLKDAKKELIDSIEGNELNIMNFGLAKDAENITKLTFALDQLYVQRQRFEFIFKDEE